MWQRIRRWLRWRDPRSSDIARKLRWVEPGPENPFGVRLLDCRPLTWNLISTTADLQIAERFNTLRRSDGRDLVGRAIENSVRVPTSLTLPHNGAPLEGIVSKADDMEVKWDIYIYDSAFLFARSWTGELCYRAFASIEEAAIRISEIEASPEHVDSCASTVYFLLVTHAMRQPFPHQIPADLGTKDPETIAMWSFSSFGKLACYATTSDITTIPIRRPSR